MTSGPDKKTLHEDFIPLCMITKFRFECSKIVVYFFRLPRLEKRMVGLLLQLIAPFEDFQMSSSCDHFDGGCNYFRVLNCWNQIWILITYVHGIFDVDILD